MSDPNRPRLKVSREGIVLIKSLEGFRTRAVRGEDGRWVIGYGHTASAREGLTVGEQDAELLLQYDLLPVVKTLNDEVSAPLNQHQFDALASFALSVGIERFRTSDVLDRLNAGHAGQAADALFGWPPSAVADAGLRRRAAERALFVADPAAPVALAELLAAPLPPPEITEPVAAASVSDARAAAVATLLGETVAPPADMPGPDAPRPSPEPAAPSAAALHLQRYSPYSAALIGPLPGFPAAAPPAPPQPPEPASVASAAEADSPFPAADDSEAVPVPAFENAPAPSFEAEPFATSITAAFPSPAEPLVLTPPTEADFADASRPAWPVEQRGESPADDSSLFEGEPAGPVLRHEAEPVEPRRFDWGETGMYLVIGGIGLASCAFSAAAFRLSATQPSPMGETTVVAWALALIGVVCVGVSSWNLYVRWGKAD